MDTRKREDGVAQRVTFCEETGVLNLVEDFLLGHDQKYTRTPPGADGLSCTRSEGEGLTLVRTDSGITNITR